MIFYISTHIYITHTYDMQLYTYAYSKHRATHNQINCFSLKDINTPCFKFFLSFNNIFPTTILLLPRLAKTSQLQAFISKTQITLLNLIQNKESNKKAQLVSPPNLCGPTSSSRIESSSYFKIDLMPPSFGTQLIIEALTNSKIFLHIK